MKQGDDKISITFLKDYVSSSVEIGLRRTIADPTRQSQGNCCGQV